MGKVTIERNNKSVIFEIKDEEIDVYPFLKNSVQALKYLDYHESLITDDFGMITTELYEERGVQICDRNEVEKNMFSKDDLKLFFEFLKKNTPNSTISGLDFEQKFQEFKEKKITDR